MYLLRKLLSHAPREMGDNSYNKVIVNMVCVVILVISYTMYLRTNIKYDYVVYRTGIQKWI